MNRPQPALDRSLGLTTMIFYGVGTIVGGGFYALLGKVAGDAGVWTPVSFLLTGLLAAASAFSFAELSARLPVSAGEAEYVQAGFRRPALSLIVGLAVALVGLVSCASLASATGGFLYDLAGLPAAGGILITVLALGAVAAWGVRQSALLVALVTLLETGTLLVVGTLGWLRPAELPAQVPELSAHFYPGVLAGAFLAFFAVIGFEDMVNMAEETRDPSRTLPRAILASLAISVLVYVYVSAAAVTRVPPSLLAASHTPIALLVRDFPLAPQVIGIISILAVLNGALVQIIMASRVLYGMANRGHLPGWLGEVHPRTRTPLVATLLCTGVVLLLALTLPLEPLARITSGLILVIFTLVNAALLRIRHREGRSTVGPNYPLWLPWLGLLFSAGMLAMELWRVLPF